MPDPQQEYLADGTFGQIVKAARARLEMTQQEVAEAVRQRGGKVTQAYVSMIERTAGTGEEPDLSWEIAEKLAQVLEIEETEALLAVARTKKVRQRREK